MRRLGKVKIEWSPQFAYAIGLIATDGNLSKDGRHMIMTSKDKDMMVTFKRCLGLKNSIGRKTRSTSKERKYFQVQFGDKNFYEFLLGLGLMPAKSKTLGTLEIEPKFFRDFLRGCIDGDGNINTFHHPESKYPQLRIRLFSASKDFILWIQKEIFIHCKISTGWIETTNGISILSYAKADSVILLNFVYYTNVRYYLKRKYNTAKPFLLRV